MRRTLQRLGRAIATLLAAALLGSALLLGGAASAATTIEGGDSCTGSDTAGCVSGTLVDANGNPVKGVTVTIKDASGASATDETDARGKFYFTVSGVSDTAAYTVSLDAASLPSGVTADTTAKTVNIGPWSNEIALFKLSGAGEGSVSHSTGETSFGERAWQQFSQGLLLGLLLALASIGLSLIYGTTGLSNFAHSEQITLGGFLAYSFAIQLGLNIILATLITVALTALSGYLQDFLIWGPLRRRGIGINQMMVATIGLSLALEYVFQLFWGARVLNINSVVEPNVGPLDITPTAYWAMLISVVVLIGVGLALMFTRFGRATRAVADNRSLAAASGINVDLVIRVVWVVATGLAGLAGVLYALVNGGVFWATGVQLLLLIFAATTLGGLGTAFGALVGSLIIGVVVQMSKLWVAEDLKYAAALVILIVILLFRPQGILGRRERVG